MRKFAAVAISQILPVGAVPADLFVGAWAKSTSFMAVVIHVRRKFAAVAISQRLPDGAVRADLFVGACVSKLASSVRLSAGNAAAIIPTMVSDVLVGVQGVDDPKAILAVAIVMLDFCGNIERDADLAIAALGEVRPDQSSDARDMRRGHRGSVHMTVFVIRQGALDVNSRARYLHVVIILTEPSLVLVSINGSNTHGFIPRCREFKFRISKIACGCNHQDSIFIGLLDSVSL